MKIKTNIYTIGGIVWVLAFVLMAIFQLGTPYVVATHSWGDVFGWALFLSVPFIFGWLGGREHKPILKVDKSLGYKPDYKIHISWAYVYTTIAMITGFYYCLASPKPITSDDHFNFVIAIFAIVGIFYAFYYLISESLVLLSILIDRKAKKEQ